MTEQANANAALGETTLSPEVIDTIIAIAVNEVEGVAAIGSHVQGGLKHILSSKGASSGIETQKDEHGNMHITLHIDVDYGYVLPELAAKVRSNVADALLMQARVEVAGIDIYVDGIRFGQQ